MSTFEFISVFVSIIFGLALAHLLTSAMHSLFKREINFERGAYVIFLLLTTLGQWWTLFRWREVSVWTFDSFFLLVVWALNVFAMPVALYPPGEPTSAKLTPERLFWS